MLRAAFLPTEKVAQFDGGHSTGEAINRTPDSFRAPILNFDGEHHGGLACGRCRDLTRRLWNHPWRARLSLRTGLATAKRNPTMGELLEALNAVDDHDPPAKSAADQAVELFRSASQKVNEAIEAVQEPGMPLDAISRWARQAPLQALAAAFLIGVMTARRRRR
jgi:hypothetical protein